MNNEALHAIATELAEQIAADSNVSGDTPAVYINPSDAGLIGLIVPGRLHGQLDIFLVAKQEGLQVIFRYETAQYGDVSDMAFLTGAERNPIGVAARICTVITSL